MPDHLETEFQRDLRIIGDRLHEHEVDCNGDMRDLERKVDSLESKLNRMEGELNYLQSQIDNLSSQIGR